MNINLPLAFIWFFVGVVLLIYHRSHPEGPFANILGTGLSGGWLAIALALYNLVRLALYNLVRWWSNWSYRTERRTMDELDARRLREREQHSRPVQEQDPNFDFGDPSKPEGQPREQK